MGHLSGIELFGYWLGIFLTFCILSFLYKDNPFYKLGEHLFIGVSIGYVVTKQYYGVLRPKLIDAIADGHWWYWFAAVLAVALLMKLFKRYAWIGKYPIAFIVGFYAGLQINGAAQGDLTSQTKAAMTPVAVERVNINTADRDELGSLPGITPHIADLIIENRRHREFQSVDEVERLYNIPTLELRELKASRGVINGYDARATVGPGKQYFWFGILSQLLMLLGMICALIYFYFSVEHTGAIGKVSRVGVWVLMIGFGASFGYTVQGRLSLAVGRALDIAGENKEPGVADQIHGPIVAAVAVAAIVLGIVIWETRQRRAATPGGPSAPPPPEPDDEPGPDSEPDEEE